MTYGVDKMRVESRISASKPSSGFSYTYREVIIVRVVINDVVGCGFVVEDG